MVAGHHQLQSVRFEEQEDHADSARNPKLKSIILQATQAQADMRMRSPKGRDQLYNAPVDFLEF